MPDDQLTLTKDDAVTPLVLNQYRQSSSYKDVVGSRYQFPNRYLKAFGQLPVGFVYYEPREGGDQVYFGAGIVRSVVADTEDASHSYADLDSYQPFSVPISFYSASNDGTWEPPKSMRNSVRRISFDLFQALLATAGLSPQPFGVADEAIYVKKLQQDWKLVVGKHDPLSLRKKRRIAEAYGRPSWVTNFVKRQRSDTCQLCQQPGFLKRDGDRYCEVHHLFHLAEEPPDDCLRPEYLVVLCATCHRRMHYAAVGIPQRQADGWSVLVDGSLVEFTTLGAEPGIAT